MTTMTAKMLKQNAPWWTFGHLWLVIAGPALVVVASFITLFLALHYPETIIAEDYYQKGLDINKANKAANTMAPAEKASHHAATGVVVDKK